MKYLLKAFLVLSLFFLLIRPTAAQFIEWEKTYSTVGTAYCIEQTDDGGYIIAGSNGDVWLLKVDANGNPEWLEPKTFGGTGYDAAYSVQQTVGEDGFAIFGYSDGQVYVIKTDLDGERVWERRYDAIYPFYKISPFAPKPAIGLQNQNGEFIVVANGANKYGPNGVFIHVIDSSGNYIKGGSLDIEEGNEMVRDIKQTTDGGYILAGEKDFYNSGCPGPPDAWLLKLDSNFHEEWETTFGDSCSAGYSESRDSALSVWPTSTSGIPDGYILTGITYPDESHISRVWLIKTLLDDGVEDWNKTYNGLFGFGVIQTEDGGYVVGARKRSLYYNYLNLLLIKTNAGGDIQWDETFSPDSYEVSWSLQPTRDGGYIVVGEKEGIWAIKISREGELTPEGYNISVIPVDPSSGESPITLTFNQVIDAGTTYLNTKSGNDLPLGFKFGSKNEYYEIITTATISAPIDICIDYSGIDFDQENNLKFFHRPKDGQWDRIPEQNITFWDKTHDLICATVSSLSDFGIFEPINQPPIANAGPDQTVQSIYADGSTLVTLDGSNSSDPDNDDIAFTWSQEGSILSTEEVAIVTLPLGEHRILLTVDDGTETASDEVFITVQATVEGLKSLLYNFVNSGKINASIASKLDDFLTDSLNNVRDGKYDKAIQNLDSFKHQVDKEHDKGNITLDVAMVLLGSGDAVINELEDLQ